MNDWRVLLRTGLPALGLAAMVAGCSAVGYNLGSNLPPEIKTVFVPSVQNDTMEPLIEAEVTRAVINEVQRDGSLKIAGSNQADSRLDILLTNYDIVPLAYDPDRLTAAEEYRIFITASFRLTATASDEVLAKSDYVRGDATFEFAGDLTSSKQRGLPLAASDLARKIVDGAVEYW